MSKYLRRPVRSWLSVLVVVCTVALLDARGADAPAPDDATAARTLFEGGNYVGALPYYERLAQKEPQNALYAERLAQCLVSQLKGMPVGVQRKAMVARIRAEALRAKSLGDNSQILQLLLGYVESGALEAGPTKDEQALSKAEEFFQRGDYDKALAEYEAVAAADPQSYAARLYAGDMYFRKGNVDAAAKWFQAAITLNPDIETAYRYWGDALAKVKREDEALGYYIQAFVAEPYNRNAARGLSQWAERNGVKMRKPNVPVPPAPTLVPQADGKPKVTLNMSGDMLNSPRTGAAWLIYSTVRANWMVGEFARQFPQEPKYRHSLAEEVSALRGALGTLKLDQLDLEGTDWQVRDLLALNKADMIEAYILLQAPDEGIAQDYVAYRNANRDRLAAYFRQFVIPPK